jgi:hypothetical protein
MIAYSATAKSKGKLASPMASMFCLYEKVTGVLLLQVRLLYIELGHHTTSSIIFTSDIFTTACAQ